MRQNIALVILLVIFTASYVYSEGFISVNDAPGTPDPNTLYKNNIISAWARFDGTDCTGGAGMDDCTITDSFNVDKIERQSAGEYHLYFKTTMANANYAGVCSKERLTSAAQSGCAIDPIDTAKVAVWTAHGDQWDDCCEEISVMFIGGQ